MLSLCNYLQAKNNERSNKSHKASALRHQRLPNHKKKKKKHGRQHMIQHRGKYLPERVRERKKKGVEGRGMQGDRHQQTYIPSVATNKNKE